MRIRAGISRKLATRATTIVVASSTPKFAWLSSDEKSDTRKPSTSTTEVMKRARPTSFIAARSASA